MKSLRKYNIYIIRSRFFLDFSTAFTPPSRIRLTHNELRIIFFIIIMLKIYSTSRKDKRETDTARIIKYLRSARRAISGFPSAHVAERGRQRHPRTIDDPSERRTKDMPERQGSMRAPHRGQSVKRKHPHGRIVQGPPHRDNRKNPFAARTDRNRKRCITFVFISAP